MYSIKFVNTGAGLLVTIISLSAIISLLSIFLAESVSACEGCKRDGYVEVTNDVIDIDTEYLYELTARSYTFEGIGSKCFFLVASPEKIEWMRNEGVTILPPELRQPDYIFRAHFENGLTGVKKPKKVILSDDTTDYWDAKSRLTVKMYYNGDTEELVDTWQTLGTTNSSSPCARHMWKYRSSEFKKKPPLEVMYRYEEVPTECDINFEKDEVANGEEIEIKLSNFTGLFGGQSKGFNRIIVHAYHGKITNGSSWEIGPDYKVFTVDDGTVTVEYQAPDECDEQEDRITVFNSCDILPESKWPLGKTEMRDRIEEKKLRIVCWEWSGTMTVERLERFDCELDESKEGHYQRSTGIHNLSTTRATVSIKAENIDDSPPGFNIEMGENLTVSGFMKCEMRNYEERNNRSFINPRTSHHVETLTGEGTNSLNDDNLDLTFTANIEDLQKDGSLDDLAEMLETGDIDEAKLEAFGAKYEESMGLGESGQSKITVLLTLFGDCMCKAILRQSGWGEQNGRRTTTNESETIDMWIGGGFALQFSADYSRNKDGSATITGNYSNTTPITDGIREGCPPKTETYTCNLTLTKRRKK